jgi:NitT/TauT family transport system permease protein
VTAGPAQHEVHQLEREIELEMHAAQPRVPRLRWRRPVAFLIVIVIILVLWEGVKLLGGTPWRLPGQGPGDPVIWNPPFRWPFANDLNLPHVWNIVWAMGQPFQRGADVSLAEYLVGAALYTWREALLGFVFGALLGLILATVFVHSRLAERAFVPYVIASQTVPIIALAPLIVFALGQGVLAVVVIATYLTFFPVTIAMLRGLRSFDPRAMELMRSYGASRRAVFWKLRLPASMPYLFTALKIAATAAIVGAIIGEDTGAIQAGLGRVITTFNQYYATGPEKLWAAIFAAAALGVAFFLLVRVVELVALRRRPGIDA